MVRRVRRECQGSMVATRSLVNEDRVEKQDHQERQEIQECLAHRVPTSNQAKDHQDQKDLQGELNCL